MADLATINGVAIGNIGAIDYVNATNIASWNNVPFVSAPPVATLSASPLLDYFEISLASIPCPGSTRTITITASAGNAWTVTERADYLWMTEVPASGTGNGSFLISTTKGTGSRTGYLDITSSAPTVTVTVIQEACA